MSQVNQPPLAAKGFPGEPQNEERDYEKGTDRQRTQNHSEPIGGGKRGLNVSQDGQFGQISRSQGRVANPRTASQMSVRAILGRVAASWRALQEVQRAAWMAAAKEAKSNGRLGQSGPLSGFQLFAKINCTLAQFGQEQVDAPPAPPQFPDLAPIVPALA